MHSQGRARGSTQDAMQAEDTYLDNKTVDGMEENTEHSGLEDHGWIT